MNLNVSNKGSISRLVCWIILCAIVSVLAYINWPQETWLKTTLDNLTPHVAESSSRQPMQQKITLAIQARTVWLVGAKDSSAALRQANELTKKLKANPIFEQVRYKIDTTKHQELYQSLYEYRYQLLSTTDQKILEQQQQDYLQQQLSLIYSPIGSLYASRLKEDPSGLFWNFYQQQSMGTAQLINDALIFPYKENYYALVIADLKKSSLKFQQAPKLMLLYKDIKAWAFSNQIVVHATGMPLFSAYGVQSGHNEILTVGTISLIAITVLLLLVFRSLRPLLITLLIISAGTIGGLVITVLIAQQIHIITLVFGAAIIGISVDYAFHYLCSNFDDDWQPIESLKRKLPSLSLGFLSSGFAFLCLILVPFSGVQHIGIFMASGLLCSWLTVILACPALMHNTQPQTLKALPLLVKPINIFSSRKLVLLLVITLSIPGLLKLNFGDDVRLFYAKPALLSDDEAMFKKIIPAQIDSRYLQIEANSVEQLLQIEESITHHLEALVDHKQLDNFKSLSSIIPSIKRQNKSWLLQKQLFQSDSFQEYLTQIGFTDEAIKQVKTNINGTTFSALTPQHIDNVLTDNQLILLPHCRKNQCTGIIQLTGIHSLTHLHSLANSHKQLFLVDNVAATTGLMKYYRNATTLLIAGTLIITFIVLSLLRGLSSALHIVSTPLLAILFSLSASGYFGQTINLFNTLALLLILGVSIDYAIFTHFAKPSEQATTVLAITLSITTTLLAFGLLSVSETPAIQSFGLTLIPGLLAAYIIAMSSFSSSKSDADPINANL